MGTFTKREQVVILLSVFIIVIILGFKFVLGDIIESRGKTIEVENVLETIDDEDRDMEDTELEDYNNEIIIVHISGQVYQSGIVELEQGARVKDAVDLAGGLKKDADIDRINLAKKLVDEEKIYIPKIGEQISTEIEILEIGTTESSKDGKININTCIKGDLVSLPGIGDVLADRIIDYREGNSFNRIEDIKNVSGIGEKKFEGIKDLIKVK